MKHLNVCLFQIQQKLFTIFNEISQINVILFIIRLNNNCNFMNNFEIIVSENAMLNSEFEISLVVQNIIIVLVFR